MSTFIKRTYLVQQNRTRTPSKTTLLQRKTKLPISPYIIKTQKKKKNTLANTTCRIYKHLCNDIMSYIITMVNVNLGALAVYIQNSGHKTSPFHCRTSQSVFWTVILVNNFVLVIIWSFLVTIRPRERWPQLSPFTLLLVTFSFR